METYRLLDERSNRYAQLFRRLGLCRGDSIALCLENHSCFFEITCARRNWGGMGPPLLLVHGTADSTFDWEVHTFDRSESEAMRRLVMIALFSVWATFFMSAPCGAEEPAEQEVAPFRGRVLDDFNDQPIAGPRSS